MTHQSILKPTKPVEEIEILLEKGSSSNPTAAILCSDDIVSAGRIRSNLPPTAQCRDVTANADVKCRDYDTVATSFNDGSTDPDGDNLYYSVDQARALPHWSDRCGT